MTNLLRMAPRTAVLAAGMTLILTSAGFAGTATRAFVSGAGSDGNVSSSCSASLPCRTLAVAYSVLAAGGDIVALDSAGYGTLAITGAVSITGPVQGAQITVGSGGTGISITAGSGVVILKNISINGGGASSSTGINLTSGRLFLENSAVKNLTTGIVIAANTKSDVVNTDIIGNGTGVFHQWHGHRSEQSQ